MSPNQPEQEDKEQIANDGKPYSYAANLLSQFTPPYEDSSLKANEFSARQRGSGLLREVFIAIVKSNDGVYG